ncbi:creatininase family protein [uncultured Paludibaculum sp.]|uniref:creatininase family protein n=1 Tax=uncultured Paludibaculum sp. TaxID=1765020 RepID=UPI002AABBAC3|nr:creatininase family protein [uncultured Paludibaculum sp.]
MKLSALTSPEIARLAPGAIAVLPVAAVEQHGPHLPVTTDTDLVTALANAAEQALADRVILCPTLPYGSSHHHLSFAGTLSIHPELFTRLVVDLVRSLEGSGFRRIVILNGHGGNITPTRQALSILAQAPVAEVALATYWELAGAVFAGQPPLESPALSHACEYETSMMLVLDSTRVHPDRAARAARPPANNYVAWEDDAPYRGISIVRRTEFLSGNGSSGEPHKATAAKGSHLLSAAVDTLIEFLTDFASWPPMEDLRNA